MTSVLIGARRDALPLDLLQANVSEDLLSDAFKDLFPEAEIDGIFKPREELAEFIYAFAQTMQGRQVIEWLLDITIRPPYRAVGKTIDETALWAAKREGLCIPGELLLAAIARGGKSIAARQTGARQ